MPKLRGKTSSTSKLFSQCGECGKQANVDSIITVPSTRVILKWLANDTQQNILIFIVFVTGSTQSVITLFQFELIDVFKMAVLLQHCCIFKSTA